MNNILIAFVIPILVIITAVILQTILKSPFKVAGIIFIGLIITALALGGTITLLGLAWGYTLLAFVSAWITCRCFRWECSCPGNNSSSDTNDNIITNNSSNNFLVTDTIDTSRISESSRSNFNNNVSDNTCLRYWRG